MTTEERLEKLERELHLMVQTARNVVSAKELILEDDNGKPRASLRMFKHWPALALFDEKGKTIWQAPR